MLEATVNKELQNVCEWLHANKLTLTHEIQLKITDRSTGTPSLLEHKEYVKYQGVLIDSHLSWKYHVDYVASKVSKIVGVIAL